MFLLFEVFPECRVLLLRHQPPERREQYRVFPRLMGRVHSVELPQQIAQHRRRLRLFQRLRRGELHDFVSHPSTGLVLSAQSVGQIISAPNTPTMTRIRPLTDQPESKGWCRLRGHRNCHHGYSGPDRQGEQVISTTVDEHRLARNRRANLAEPDVVLTVTRGGCGGRRLGF